MSIERKLDIVLNRIKGTWHTPGTFEHLFDNDPFDWQETRLLLDKIIKDGYAIENSTGIKITVEGLLFIGYRKKKIRKTIRYVLYRLEILAVIFGGACAIIWYLVDLCHRHWHH